jgi:hypothetical protein
MYLITLLIYSIIGFNWQKNTKTFPTIIKCAWLHAIRIWIRVLGLSFWRLMMKGALCFILIMEVESHRSWRVTRKRLFVFTGSLWRGRLGSKERWNWFQRRKVLNILILGQEIAELEHGHHISLKLWKVLSNLRARLRKWLRSLKLKN